MVYGIYPGAARTTGPRKLRLLPYRAFFRPFGRKTTCYVQSHFAWLRLSDDDVVLQSAPCGPPSPQRAYDNIICHSILRPSLESLPGQTRGLPIRELASSVTCRLIDTRDNTWRR